MCITPDTLFGISTVVAFFGFRGGERKVVLVQFEVGPEDDNAGVQVVAFAGRKLVVETARTCIRREDIGGWLGRFVVFDSIRGGEVLVILDCYSWVLEDLYKTTRQSQSSSH